MNRILPQRCQNKKIMNYIRLAYNNKIGHACGVGMEAYTALIFNNHEDFEIYKKAVNLKPENIALSKDLLVTVMIKTELIIPSGSLIVKTSDGREITIKVSSGFMK